MTDLTLEAISKQMADIAELVKNHKSDPATVDQAALAREVQGMVDTQVAAALAKAEKNRPVRRGELIGPANMPGFQVPSKGLVEGGKFDGIPADDVLFAHWLLDRGGKKNVSRHPSKDLSDTVARIKALDATTAGAGDEYVPTGMAAQLWTDFFLASKIVAALGTVPMPTDPFDFPLGFGSITWRKGTPNVAPTSNTPTTAKSTMTATEILAEVDWAYDLDEDAVIAVLPSLRTELARSGGEAMDAFALNADSTDAGTGNINLDDANPPDDSYYLSLGQDGLRHLSLVDNTGQVYNMAGALTDAGMRLGLAKLGKYASTPGETVIIVDAATYVGVMVGLTNVATVDKFGPSATILNGQLAQYAGVPVIVSASMGRTEANGFISTTAGSNTKGQIVIANRNSWKVGFRRQMMIELDRFIQKRQLVMVVSFREALAAFGTRSSATHTASIIDIT